MEIKKKTNKLDPYNYTAFYDIGHGKVLGIDDPSHVSSAEIYETLNSVSELNKDH